MLEPALRLGVAAERRAVVRAVGHRLLEPVQLLLCCDQVGRAREHVLPERQTALERRALVVQRHTRALGEDELAALVVGLAVEDPEQRRLAGAVRPRERHAVPALDLERDVVEQLPA